MKDQSKYLGTVLTSNAIFSSLSGAAMLIFGNWLSDLIGVEQSWVVWSIGAGLLLFAISIILAMKKLPSLKSVRWIIVQDWAWVIAATIIIALRIFDLTVVGYWLLAMVSIPVALFAWLQGKYAKQLNAAP